MAPGRCPYCYYVVYHTEPCCPKCGYRDYGRDDYVIQEIRTRLRELDQRQMMSVVIPPMSVLVGVMKGVKK
jgi:hypothetical protein